MQKLSLYFFASLLAGCLAFSTFSMKKSSHRNAREPGNALCMLARDEVRVTAAQRESDACNRRAFLGVASVVASFFLANPASARDELYRSNMLTNPVLEQVSSFSP